MKNLLRGVCRWNRPDNIHSPSLRCEYAMPVRLDDWTVDPILVDYQDKTQLFYESVKGLKGRIEVVEVSENCTLSRFVVRLRENTMISILSCFVPG